MIDRSEHAVLNHLVETCRDAERGFQKAADRVTDPELRTLFAELAAERAAFAIALLPHVQRMGGDGPSDGSTAAALHRGWMDLKGALLHNDGAVVSEVRRGDSLTLKAYVDAVNGMLAPETREIVQRQCDAIAAARARIPIGEQKG